MKKPFIETKFGKFVTTPIVKGLLKSLPFVGEPLENILDETKNTQPGQVDKTLIGPQIIRVLYYILLIYLAFRGIITFEEAETAKEFVSP